MFEAILKDLQAFRRIIIHRHGRPDGDAIGSQVGLKYIIKENFPDKEVYAVGDAPGFFGFVEGSQMDQVPDSFYEDALAVILDCGGANMINDDRYTLAKKTVRMDHHLFTGAIAQNEVIDSSYESCCGLVAHLAKESGLRLNPIAAKALYTGMVTDSGRFRYDATTSRTFSLASFLLETPFDITEIYRHLYADSIEGKKLKAKFVLKIQFTPNNVAYIYTTKEEVAELGVDLFTVSRGMVNTMADIKDVNIWCNFTETDGGVQCEIRSSIYNINPVAVKYGGGGHAKASGATVADYETAMAMLEDLNTLAGEEV